MRSTKGKKIILVPYPAQGHVTPMLKLASVLASEGLSPIMVVPEFIHGRVTAQTEPEAETSSGVCWVQISDGLEGKATRDFFTIESAMENVMPIQLERIIREYQECGEEVICVVLDLLASWAIQVADACGVKAAGFWPAMLAAYRLISSIPNLLRSDLISDTGNPTHEGKICCVQGQPALSILELPWLIGTPAARQSRFKFWTRTMYQARSLRWIIANTFMNEFNAMQQQEQLSCLETTEKGSLHIFPLVPLSMHAIITKNPSFWEEDMSCMNWLDKQKPSSVIYISFGSYVSPIEEEKLRNIALGLEASKCPFVWGLRSSWRDGLPDGYLKRVSKQGKIVSWAPQMEVLKHAAIGCYLTHCGWNSILEAIQCERRLLCYPVAGDQFLNCAYVVQVWKIGADVGGFGQRDVEEGIRRVMGDEEMKRRVSRMKERAMGEEAASKAKANLMVFLDDLNKH
ncbi:UDP-glucuronosyl/UDP-glucosyltransferase, partial [Dillenia turbinata]